jgi:hypothetical protein
MENLIFANKYWPNDHRFGCNAPKIMGEVVDLKVDLGEKFKGVLEHEEAFDVHDRSRILLSSHQFVSSK